MALDKNSNRLPIITNVFYLPVELISAISIYSSDRFIKNVYLVAEAAPLEIYFSPGSAIFEEKDKQDDAGLLHEQSLKMNFPGDDNDNPTLFDALRNHPLLVVFQYNDGTKKFFGCPENGARFAKSSRFDVKNAGSEFTFSCSSQETAWWLNYIGQVTPA